MKRTILFFLFITIFLVFQTATGYSKSQEIVFEIKTRFGSFPLTIPALRLPKLQKIPLAIVSDPTLPDLLDFYDSRYIPENPSWLDQAGKFYKEGIENLFRGEINLALKRFKKVISEYPETNWHSQSWFWYGQITTKQEKYEEAEKSFKFFLDLIKKGDTPSFSEYINLSRYTLIWLTLKQKKFKQALSLIEKFESKIVGKKIQNQLHYLKYLTYLKLNKTTDPIFALLDYGIQKFPYDFEHVVRLAEYYFMTNSWYDLADFVTIQASKPSFYNEPQMEYFLWLGVVAEMNLKRWSKAIKKLNFLEELGVRNRDTLSRAYFVIFLEKKKFNKAWSKWLEIEDDFLREQSLRELMHYAIKNDDLNFLQKKMSELKKVTQFWRSWQSELELIYAYLYLRLDQRKKAKQWFQWSLNNSLGKEEKSFAIVHEESIFFRTVIYLISVEYKKAFLNLKKLLEDYSDSKRLSDYYFWYGVLVYEIEKKHLDAIMAIRQVEQKGERDDDRWFLLGKINFDQQKWRPAIFSFTSLKRKYPNSRFLEEGLFLQAQAYYEQKRYNSSLEILNELKEMFAPIKKPVRAIQLRVRILLAMKKYEQADDVLRRRIALSSDLSLIKLRVEVLKNIKDPLRILAVTGEGLGISTSEDQGFLYFHRANALYDTQKYKEADTYYNLAVKNPPKGSERIIHYRILKIQYILGRIPELLKDTEEFLKVNNDDDFSNEILLLIGNYFIEKGEKEKASPYINQLLDNYKRSVRQIELDPKKRVEQIFIIGKLYNGLQKFDLAERWLNQALKSMETMEEGKKIWQLQILKEKGIALFYLGKHRQALGASLKVLYLDHTMSDQQIYNLNLRIASSYAQLERKNEAEAIYRKMLKKFKAEKRQLEVEKLLRKLKK